MRIISKQSDYYDSIIAYGHDAKSAIYLREEKVLLDVNHHDLFRRTNGYGRLNVDSALINKFKPLSCGTVIGERNKRNFKEFKANFETVTVLLAGKLFGGLRVQMTRGDGWVENVSTFYDVCSVEKYLNSYGHTLGDLDHRDNRWWRKEPEANRTIREQLELKGDPRFMNLAIELKAPVLLISERSGGNFTVKLDPILKDYQFYKAVESFTTFQEIDMFVSGIMAPENRPTVTIEDKYKIQEHGFDKWSFKNLPTKKK